MKIHCEVLAVETSGESLVITLQGRGKKDAEWRPLNSQTIKVANTAKNCSQFCVGRRVDLDVRVRA